MKRVVDTTKMKGFTIVELMMATAVFAVILLLVTMGIIQVTRVYYKGVTEANTQNVARNVVNTIAQAIQFDGGSVTPIPTTSPPVAGTMYHVCVNNEEFVYWPGYELVSGSVGTDQTNQALIEKQVSGCPTPTAPVTGGHELLSPSMRVSNLQISQIGTSNLYKVEVRISYGDDAVLTNPTTTTDTCNNIQTGNQFCAYADISTIVEQRIN